MNNGVGVGVGVGTGHRTEQKSSRADFLLPLPPRQCNFMVGAGPPVASPVTSGMR